MVHENVDINGTQYKRDEMQMFGKEETQGSERAV